MSSTKPYRAEATFDQGVPIVRLTDAAHDVELSILPSLGNRAYRMRVRGADILYYPSDNLPEHLKSPSLGGIPFLAPWADLLDEKAFWANGRRYAFNIGLGNVQGDRPIHGLLTDSALWEVLEVADNNHCAYVTSRLQFWKYPDLMAQWPFAHEYTMTYRLSGGVLQVETTITNLSAAPMPVSIGFHPYFQIPGIPRDEWVATLPVRIHVVADENLVPTGEMRPMDLPNPLPLRGQILDDGFTDLERDSEGWSQFSIASHGKAIEISFGPKYRAATIYLPELSSQETGGFICIEPLAAIINGVNSAHRGKYSELQILPAGNRWTESFRIRASGF